MNGPRTPKIEPADTILRRADTLASDVPITLTAPSMVVGALVRRRVRVALDAARILGADVQYSEHWGLLESVFVIRAEGTRAALEPLFQVIRAAVKP